MSFLKSPLPMYEGDSYIRPGLAALTATPRSPQAPTIVEPIAPLTVEDLVRIDRDAHRMRADAVAALFSGGWTRLVAFIKGDGKSFEEQYLAQSTDLVDLERRQRDLVRGNRFRMPLGRPSYV